jgi:hypothetical protein
MMNRFRVFLFLIAILATIPGAKVTAQASDNAVITNPQAGQVIQGTISITGTDIIEGFLGAEVAFAYSGDSLGTWFPIGSSDQPVEEGTLAVWDTSAITDGNYSLRLRIHLSDGSIRDILVPELRVRNYSLVETPTPTPTVLAATAVPTRTITMAPTVFPTPTLLRPNEAVITPSDVTKSIMYGGVAAMAILLAIGIYGWIRRK